MQHILSEYIALLPPSVQEVLEVLLRNPLYVSYATTALSAVTIGYLLYCTRQIPFLDPKEFKPLRLVEKVFVNHNTMWMRFALSTKHQPLGLPIGQHMSFLAKDENGKDIYRSYTPISDDQQRGSVDFVIKVYPQGKMSQALKRLPVGQCIKVKGPKGRLEYKPNMKKHIGMLAGGTGVTPMYQVLNAILKNPADKTQVSLIFGNIAEEDILLRKELDSLAQAHPGQLKVLYVLNNPPKDWKGGAGFITPDMIKSTLPAPGPDSLVLRCGPPPMLDAMKKHLDSLGYSADMQFQF
ncbi:hypothetical protein DUNSADRAFT_18392 [Dunaliella salina]|uniref:NADH-cytochrome b5 reductase n=1 Tax=Dunaliella salina TaxID=3046 RepID=A0ABQ7G056_DUNSA|nr:hypothetical protein DUNSADRAFT_18392 [Dunaliella salina]|eukprot:KAF5827986.1 hypothetical protein DUNSADRAFT_18392 [Dunaliella salina]